MLTDTVQSLVKSGVRQADKRRLLDERVIDRNRRSFSSYQIAIQCPCQYHQDKTSQELNSDNQLSLLFQSHLDQPRAPMMISSLHT
jgi:hypothetical protein